MRKCVLFLSALVLSLGIASCGAGAPGAPAEAPELFAAVPSDAQQIGVFSHLDNALSKMIDSTSNIHKIDFGRLARSRAVVAGCDLGALTALVIVEAGKASADTLAVAADVMAQADSAGIFHKHITLGQHNALLLSGSETLMLVAARNLASETSILDAPGFGGVVDVLPSGDCRIYRNSASKKLFKDMFSGYLAARVPAFLKDASEWMVRSESEIVPVCPEGEKYYTNFCASLQEAPSRLPEVMPEDYTFFIDIPIASAGDYRIGYERWLDARVVLEAYNNHISRVWSATGKDPRAWEKEAGVREASVVFTPRGRINLIRVKDKATSDGVVPNPLTGIAYALYGNIFDEADSCMLRRGNWIISGQRDALELYSPAAKSPEGWLSKAKVAAGSPDFRVSWKNDDRIKLWHSNQ